MKSPLDTHTENTSIRQRRVLLDAFAAALARSLPDGELRRHLPPIPREGRLVLLGAGKAAAHMASIAEEHYLKSPDSNRLSGLIVTPNGISVKLRRLEHAYASHPYPDAASEAAANRMIVMVTGLSADDHVVMLLSGGASSLLCAPIDGISFQDKRDITESLSSAGASIDELNLVRKYLSAIKGGRLARLAAPARVTTLAISDVVGDDPAVIGSAPTYEAPVSAAEVLAIFDRYRVRKPARLAKTAAANPALPAAPNSRYVLIARPLLALEAAAELAESRGYRTTILGDDIEGEARSEAVKMAAAVRSALASPGPQALLSGGEVTVRLGNAGGAAYGGPNREFALALAHAIAPDWPVTALVADTDGVDGRVGASGPVAGAFVDGMTVDRARTAGLDASSYLEQHDSGTFFELLRDEVITGPTGTNVNDFRMILIR